MNSNQEGFPSENERVTSFMQALQRMHDDPAEAVRLGLMVEEAEVELVAHESGADQPLTVHIHNEGRVEFSAPRKAVDAEPDQLAEPAKPERPKRSFLTMASTAAGFPLALMALVVVFSMQDGSSIGWVSAAMSVVFTVTAASLTLATTLPRRYRRQAAQLQSAAREHDEARELNPPA